MSNPRRRSPSVADALIENAPSGPRLAPPGAYADLAVSEAGEAADAVAQLATHPVDTVGQAVGRAVEMEIATWNEVMDAFTKPAPPGETPMGTVARYASAGMGVLGLVEQVQYVGLAALTAPIAAIMPPLPVVRLTSAGIGIPHAHNHPPSFVPPAPPCPLPSFGVVALPGALSVLVGGIPAARAGDVGLIFSCVSLGVPFEIMLGSSNTLMGGNRAARIGTDMWFHDNPGEVSAAAVVMMGLGAAAAQMNAVAQAEAGNFVAAGLSMAQQAADAAAFALKMLRRVDPGMPPDVGTNLVGDFTVLVGGMPLPAAMSIADIIGRIKKGLANRAARRARAESDEGAPGRSGRTDDESGAGGGSCPV